MAVDDLKYATEITVNGIVFVRKEALCPFWEITYRYKCHSIERKTIAWGAPKTKTCKEAIWHFRREHKGAVMDSVIASPNTTYGLISAEEYPF